MAQRVVILCWFFMATAVVGAPIALRNGPHLFLDDFLIEQSTNLVRTIHCPQRDLDGPVVTGRADRNFQPYVTVLRDAQSGKFRMWYDVAVNGGQSHLATIESTDGIRWNRPHRVLSDPGPIAFGASVLDEGPAFADRARRYKFAWYHDGMMLARSSNGLNWIADPARPVITGINDILHLALDPARNRHVAVFGFPSQPQDGYKGHTQNSRDGYRRCVGQSTSTDCVHWTPPRRIFAPDKQDEGITEFYSVGGIICRGETLVGVLKVLRDDLPCDPDGKVDGIGYTVLAWSHDGETWQRDRQPFFDRNRSAGTWDHAMAWMDYQLPVGDEVWIYYGGYAGGHKVERFTQRQIGLVRMNRDRYVAQVARGRGWLRSRLLSFDADTISLNVDARAGTVRAQIINNVGDPLPGFAFADCAPLSGDTLSGELRWKQPLSTIRNKPVRLDIELSNAELFALYVNAKGGQVLQ